MTDLEAKERLLIFLAENKIHIKPVIAVKNKTRYSNLKEEAIDQVIETIEARLVIQTVQSSDPVQTPHTLQSNSSSGSEVQESAAHTSLQV